MNDVELVAWHEESPPPRLTQMSLGARRGRDDAAPMFTQTHRRVEIAAPAPARKHARFIAALKILASWVLP